MAFLSLFFFCGIPIFFIGEVDGTIILNATAAAEFHFFQGNKELLKYAALSGEMVHLSVELHQQTLVAQHNVNVTLDCLSLLEGKPTGQNISWSVLFEGEKEFKELSKRIEKISGFQSSRLNFMSNRFSSAGFVTGNKGTYRCGICEEEDGVKDYCKYHNITVFLVGGAPILDINNKEPESYMPGHDYKIGSKFCLEKNKRACRIILLCTLYNKDVAIPIPDLQWQLDGQAIFSNPSGMINTDFLMSGSNMLLSPGLINPTPVRSFLDFIEINLCFHNVTMVELLPDGINAHNVEDKLFDLILGQWTCQQNNSFGVASATTYISECGILPGFRENRRVVNESDGTFTVCIESSIEYSFNIYSTNGVAREPLDYLKVNSSWRDGDNSSCFEITIIDDNIEEIPEVFEVHLDVYKDGKSVRADNHTLAVIILDNGSLDYEETPNQLLFNQNQQRLCFNVQILDDTNYEKREEFWVNLTTIDDRIILSPKQVAIILDDNEEVTIGWEHALYTVGENDGQVELCAGLSTYLEDVVRKTSFRAIQGTAIRGKDFSFPPGTEINFPKGSSSINNTCYTVTLLSEIEYEGEKNFTIEIVPNGAERLILDPQITTIVITDYNVITKQRPRSACDGISNLLTNSSVPDICSSENCDVLTCSKSDWSLTLFVDGCHRQITLNVTNYNKEVPQLIIMMTLYHDTSEAYERELHYTYNNQTGTIRLTSRIVSHEEKLFYLLTIEALSLNLSFPTTAIPVECPEEGSASTSSNLSSSTSSNLSSSGRSDTTEATLPERQNIGILGAYAGIGAVLIFIIFVLVLIIISLLIKLRNIKNTESRMLTKKDKTSIKEQLTKDEFEIDMIDCFAYGAAVKPDPNHTADDLYDAIH